MFCTLIRLIDNSRAGIIGVTKETEVTGVVGVTGIAGGKESQERRLNYIAHGNQGLYL